MIYLFLILLPLISSAFELVHIQSLSEGSYRQEFQVKDTIRTFRTNFNVGTQYQVGLFKSAKVDQDLVHKIDAISAKLAKLDKELGDSSSFNKLSKQAPHAPHIILDGFKITPSSVLYEELRRHLSSLIEQDWKLADGVQLESDLTKISYYKDSKLIKSEEFNDRFYCQAIQKFKRCQVKDLGYVYLK